MAEIKLIGIDVDNTLVNAKKKIAPQVKDAIFAAQQRGIKVVICTGRSLSGTQQYLKELGMTEKEDQYIVGFNGAVVETTNGNEIFAQQLSYENYLDLERIAREAKLHFQAVGANRIYTANRDLGYYTVYNSRVVKMGISYRTKEEMANLPIYKCMYLDPPEHLDKFVKSSLFKDAMDKADLTRTEPIYLEAVTKGINKGTGLAALCSHLGLSAENVMTIGDESNDISMLKYAGCGVAMGNAVPDVKKVADMVTADCEHAGVAKAIKEIL
ncbi:sugar-phosphatase [Lactobacillus sp. ESL0791]|uniref:sugar-phosphatase n=1 Tax=Lactobacillus sp. ESL0791 TaxID=2983234 RepID=UPI0023F9818C|nr:sugar-phosphatase [Lactobacillus sp. ESL0791]MDF7638322.1 sugar-phosphatase [Lactobacillus sp. ESL0791]